LCLDRCQFARAQLRYTLFRIERRMAISCRHLATICDVVPSAPGCEECLKTGSPWVHLRICRTCGYVGCCDESPNRHTTKHFRASGHPVIEAYDPPEGWGCATLTRSSSIFRAGRRRISDRFPDTIETRARASAHYQR
jgi:hypothetical protein